MATALVLLACLTTQAETTAGPGAKAAEAKQPGFTVQVEFYVDPAGNVTHAKVLKSDADVLNSFALAAVQAGRLNPQPLPAAGSEPQQVTSELFYPVDAYDSGKPIPPGVLAPRPKFQPSPAYPFQYRNKKITGGAWLSVTIGKTGRVTECKVVKASHPEFGAAAEQAVYKWQFRPATLNGEPVEVTLNVPISFQIEGQSFGWRWLVAPSPNLLGFSVTTNAP